MPKDYKNEENLKLENYTNPYFPSSTNELHSVIEKEELIRNEQIESQSSVDEKTLAIKISFT